MNNLMTILGLCFATLAQATEVSYEYKFSDPGFELNQLLNPANLVGGPGTNLGHDVALGYINSEDNLSYLEIDLSSTDPETTELLYYHTDGSRREGIDFSNYNGKIFFYVQDNDFEAGDLTFNGRVYSFRLRNFTNGQVDVPKYLDPTGHVKSVTKLFDLLFDPKRSSETSRFKITYDKVFDEYLLQIDVSDALNLNEAFVERGFSNSNDKTEALLSMIRNVQNRCDNGKKPMQLTPASFLSDDAGALIVEALYRCQYFLSLN